MAEFWWNGGGPCTHGELSDIFEEAGLTDYPSEGSKRERVREAIGGSTGTPQFWPLVEQLLASLGDYDYLTPGSMTYNDKDVRRLHRALAGCGRGVGESGRLTGGTTPSVAQTADRVLSRPVLRQHIDRLRAAAQREDVEHVLGTAKELIESTVALVLTETGVEATADEHLPQRAKKAQQALLLHGAVHDVSGDFGRHVKTILSSMSAIANATVELRNAAGTGHGRVAPIVSMSQRHAKLVAGAAIVYCEMLLDTLDDPEAPWRNRSIADDSGSRRDVGNEDGSWSSQASRPRGASSSTSRRPCHVHRLSERTPCPVRCQAEADLGREVVAIVEVAGVLQPGERYLFGVA